jgi:hypothetical protein
MVVTTSSGSITLLLVNGDLITLRRGWIYDIDQDPRGRFISARIRSAIVL